MEPDRIDMMDAEELRVELRRMMGWAENWKRCAAAWREIDRLLQHDAPDAAEHARVRAQTAEECAADLYRTLR